MRLLHSVNVSDLSTTYYIPSGQFGAFVIEYSGTNAAGQTATRDNMGQVLFNHNNYPLIDCDAELISYLNDLKGGFSTFSSTIASTFYATLYVPCGDFYDINNCYTVDKNDAIFFKLDFAGFTGVLASGTVRIYGIYKEGIQNYLYGIHQRNVVAGGSGRISDVHRLDNIFTILLKAFGSTMTRVQITRDGQNLFDCDTTTALALSNFNNQVESSNQVIELDLNYTKDVKELLSREIQFDYTFTGALTLEQYFTHKIFTPNKAVQSKVMNQSKLQNKVTQNIIKNVPVIIPIEPSLVGKSVLDSQS